MSSLRTRDRSLFGYFSVDNNVLQMALRESDDRAIETSLAYERLIARYLESKATLLFSLPLFLEFYGLQVIAPLEELGYSSKRRKLLSCGDSRQRPPLFEALFNFSRDYYEKSVNLAPVLEAAKSFRPGTLALSKNVAEATYRILTLPNLSEQILDWLSLNALAVACRPIGCKLNEPVAFQLFDFALNARLRYRFPVLQLVAGLNDHIEYSPEGQRQLNGMGLQMHGELNDCHLLDLAVRGHRDPSGLHRVVAFTADPARSVSLRVYSVVRALETYREWLRVQELEPNDPKVTRVVKGEFVCLEKDAPKVREVVRVCR